MTRKQYLRSLELKLLRLPLNERDEILTDYAEHFDIGSQEGLTDQQIILRLGPPQTVAEAILPAHLASSPVARGSFVRESLRSIFTLVALTPFNFIVFFGPFSALMISLIVGWLIPVGLFLSAFGAGWWAFYTGAASSIWMGLSIFCGLIGLLSLSVVFLLLMQIATEYSFRLVFLYIKWNAKLIVPQTH